MNRKMIGLLLGVWPLAAGLASAQQADPNEVVVRQTAQLASKYEDVETLRGLLLAKLRGLYVPAGPLVQYGQGSYRSTMGGGGMAPMSTWLDSGGQGKVSAVELEGVYLKGQGVVYSVTLPPPAQDPRATARMSAKARSDWERMRQALRRGKPEAQEKPRAVRSPSLTETILKVLAKNGRHFSWLGDEESLTVVITFRAPRQSITPRASASSLTFPNPSYRPNQAVFAPQNSAGGEGGGYRTRDYELLGDLHLKQGRAQEGLNAYQKGIELEPENAKLVRLWRKIAQAYLTLGKDDQAAKALEMVLKIEKKTAQPVDKKAAKSSMPLPAKLIISAPKKLLEQLDKITYEEFHKGATVQYLTFSKP